MDIHFQNGGAEWRADCVLAFAFAGDDPSGYAPALWQHAPWLEISPGMRDFTGEKGQSLLLFGHPENPIPRVLLCGLGEKGAFKAETLRVAVAKAMVFCRERAYATVGLPFENLERPALRAAAETDRQRAPESLIREVVAAALLGLHRGDICRSGDGGDEDAPRKTGPARFSLLFTEKHTPDAAHRAAREGEAEARGVIAARDLGNSPANILTPAALAERAEALARKGAFACTVLDAKGIRDKGMGALAAVGQGADHEPRFIILEHCPKGKEADKPVVIVGKGITFDTGGISLKPPAKMHEMKGDMGGAGAVLGLFAALAEMPASEELPRLIGLVPAAENMPGGHAVRPGDVVATLSGKTVEILNTDAEGRLVLCDAITYAQEIWSPLVLIDIATLTGACVIALGDYGTGLFTGDAPLRRAILDSAEDSGDLVWPLPLWDEYDDNLKSDIADMTNMGPREGGALNAALFLRRFVRRETRWAHLDIAGPGYVVKGSPLLPTPGATGMGVRLFCRLLARLRDEGALNQQF